MTSATERREIRWGMIGAGNVTESKSGPAFNKVAGSSMVAVMRRTAHLAKDYALRHGIPNWFADADELFDCKEVNAVYIATPPNMHAEYAIRAMKAGKPVYVEKPMALNYEACRKMLKASQETGQPLFVAYYRRALPAFVKVKELIDTGQIGNPLMVEVVLHREARENDLHPDKNSWHVNPQIAGGGYFFDLASHQMDYLDFLFGPVTEAKGIAVNQAGYYAAEDTVTGTFSFENGVSGTGSWCFVAPKQAVNDIIKITGTKGFITIPTFTHGEVMMHNHEGVHKFRFQNPENIQFNLIRQVVAELQGLANCLSTGESAARTSAVLEEMVKGYYRNQNSEPVRTKGSCRVNL